VSIKALENNWRQKSLENLEKRNFGNPHDAPTPMVERCLILCKIPLEKFTVEELRLMIGQNFSLQYLIPLAMEHLRNDILTEGDFFPGDLLKNVLSIDTRFWTENKMLWEELNELIKDSRGMLATEKIPTLVFDSALKK
jgi:hypothetical protein